MRAKYSRHYREEAEGHIFLEKAKGAVTIDLTGAGSMTQEELDFYGKLFETAIKRMTAGQQKKAAELGKRTRI